MIFDNLKNRGTLYGDGIFETMRVGPKGVWQMDAHIDRLKKTATYFDLEELFDIAVTDIEDLKTKKVCLIRVTLIRDGDDSPLPGNEGGVFWNQRDLPTISAPKLIGLDGLYVSAYKLHEFKTTSYLRSIHCKKLARDSGNSDGLMLSQDGYVGEASTSNVWAVFEDRVVTPSIAGVLPGIVRARILDAGLGGLPIEERPLKISELMQAKEIALSSVGIGVVAAASFQYKEEHLTLDRNWSDTVDAELFRDW